MDFVRLGTATPNLYTPDLLIEGYNSLIWTERFQAPGEFELKSFDVERLGALLPEDTPVSHLETKEVMLVETHEINMVGDGEDAQPEITIRGRSATVIFESRWVQTTYGKKRTLRKRYSSTSAAAVLMVNAVDNASGYDITRGDTAASTAEYNDYSWTTRDVIPNVAITETVPAEGAARWFYLEQGILYPQLLKILDSQNLDVRMIRPVSPNPGTVVTVKSNLSERGTVVRTAYADLAVLRFDIYKPIDRSGSVQFSLLQGHIDKPQYLTSSQELKTVVEIKSGEIAVSDVYRPGESTLTGWKRKTMEYDAGTPEIPPAPEKPDELRKNATRAQRLARADAMDAWLDKYAAWKNKRATIVADFREEVAIAALAELNKARRVNMFSGDVSILAPYTFKVDYDLGDTVMLYGDYGKSAKMVVSEYVRTENADGDQGFPGLVAP